MVVGMAGSAFGQADRGRKDHVARRHDERHGLRQPFQGVLHLGVRDAPAELQHALWVQGGGLLAGPRAHIRLRAELRLHGVDVPDPRRRDVARRGTADRRRHRLHVSIHPRQRTDTFSDYLPFNPTFETPDRLTLVWKSEEPTQAPTVPPYIPILPEHVWGALDGKPRRRSARSRRSRRWARGPSSSPSGRATSSGGWRPSSATSSARPRSMRSCTTCTATTRRWSRP